MREAIVNEIKKIDKIKQSINPAREELINHPLYSRIRSIENLRRFMEYHIFAVWDFMCLLKALQSRLTRIKLPWFPLGDPLGRRLVNEIVLGEESDEYLKGRYLSHFELYYSAMKQIGADTGSIERFLAELRKGTQVIDALRLANAPEAARDFVAKTWEVIKSDKTHVLASAFTFGREDFIPAVFKNLVQSLSANLPHQLNLLKTYLNRHIELDEKAHRPMALRMVAILCKNDPNKWRESEKAALFSLNARKQLWDAILNELEHFNKTSAPKEKISLSIK